MATYHNMMEDILEMEYDALKNSLGTCTCDKCRNDVIAFALNHMSPRYVVNVGASVMVKLESWRQQALTDARTALTRAAMLVAENPRHE